MHCIEYIALRTTAASILRDQRPGLALDAAALDDAITDALDASHIDTLPALLALGASEREAFASMCVPAPAIAA